MRGNGRRRQRNDSKGDDTLSVFLHGNNAIGSYADSFRRIEMEEKIRLKIRALEEAVERTASPYLKRDYQKQIKKLKAMLKRLRAEGGDYEKR